jgi:SHS2 domain-containing protein
MFEFMDHTADVAIRLTSRDEEEFFRDAASAVVAILLDLKASAALVALSSIPVRLEAEDPESLLIDFLNELIFLFDTTGFLPRNLQVTSVQLGSPAHFHGQLEGDTFDPVRHHAKTEIKAATFHGLEVRKARGGLQADVVFDL